MNFSQMQIVLKISIPLGGLCNKAMNHARMQHSRRKANMLLVGQREEESVQLREGPGPTPPQPWPSAQVDALPVLRKGLSLLPQGQRASPDTP